MTEYRAKIFNHWIHSHEEDAENKKIFRNETFEFPPSRGREGMDIYENGTIIFRNITPDDRIKQSVGTFEIQEPNTLNIYFSDTTPELTMKMLSCETGKLIIEKR